MLATRSMITAARRATMGASHRKSSSTLTSIRSVTTTSTTASQPSHPQHPTLSLPSMRIYNHILASSSITSSVSSVSRRYFSNKSSEEQGKDQTENASEESDANKKTVAAAKPELNVFDKLLKFATEEVNNIAEVVKKGDRPKRIPKRRLLDPKNKPMCIMDPEDVSQMDVAGKEEAARRAEAAATENARAEAAEADAAAEASGEKKEGEEDGERKEGEGEGEEAEEVKKGPSAVMVSGYDKPTVWGQRIDSLKESIRSSPILRSFRVASRELEKSENETVVKIREARDTVKDRLSDIREDYETSQHPLVWKIRDAQDTVFSESAAAHAMGKLLAIDPTFDLLGLKEDLEEYMIPVVIKAFQRGDMDVLRSTCGGEALAGVSAAIKERMTRGHLHAEGLLDLHHVTISDPKFESGTPLMNVTFVVQQIHCIRNKKGEIVEGGESEIYNVYYQWMLRREFGNPDSDWRIVKFGFQQVLTLV